MFSNCSKKRLTALALLTVFLASSASGAVLIDSKDWTDVYSGMFHAYENMESGEPYFVKNPYASNILSGKIFPEGDVKIIESTDSPYNGAMKSRLEASGNYNIKEVIRVESGNLELIPESQEDFIVVPGDYPAAAVTAVPLARVTNSWVLIVEDSNLDEVETVLKGAEGDVTMIGAFTREVNNTVSEYADEKIISTNSHNLSVKVAKEFAVEKNFTSVILSPGTHLSKTVFERQVPVLVTLERSPSKPVKDYLSDEDSQVRTVWLTNPEYSVIGQKLDNEIDRDIAVMVKIGQARADRTKYYAPSMFPLPGGNVKLDLAKAVYNPSTGSVLLTFSNPSEVKVFQISGFRVVSGGETVAAANDASPVLIGAKQNRTVSYSVDMESGAVGEDTHIALSTTYGTNPDSLENVLTNKGNFSRPYIADLTVENFADNSNISLEEVVYLPDVNRFKVVLSNKGTVPAYATVDLRGVEVSGLETSFTKESGKIGSGETETVYISAELDRIDLEQNEEISVRVNYGSRQDIKLKEIDQEVEFRTQTGLPIVGSFSMGTTALGALLIVLLAAGILAEIKYSLPSRTVEHLLEKAKTKNDEDEEGYTGGNYV